MTSPFDHLERAAADRSEHAASVSAQAAAASTSGSPASAASAGTDAGTDAGARDEGAGRDWRSAPGLEPRNLVFAVQDGEVVAVVTDQHGTVVRTVPPEELEEVRRAQARSGILVDVRV